MIGVNIYIENVIFFGTNPFFIPMIAWENSCMITEVLVITVDKIILNIEEFITLYKLNTARCFEKPGKRKIEQNTSISRIIRTIFPILLLMKFISFSNFAIFISNNFTPYDFVFPFLAF